MKTTESWQSTADCTALEMRQRLNTSREFESHTFRQSIISEFFGDPDVEFLRLAAVDKCREMLSLRGWSSVEGDPKSVVDLYAIRNKKTISFQIRSSKVFLKTGHPVFRVGKVSYNTKRMTRTTFQEGDFDYWFFYSITGDAWCIPFGSLKNRNMVSVEKLQKYKL